MKSLKLIFSFLFISTALVGQITNNYSKIDSLIAAGNCEEAERLVLYEFSNSDSLTLVLFKSLKKIKNCYFENNHFDKYIDLFNQIEKEKIDSKMYRHQDVGVLYHSIAEAYYNLYDYQKTEMLLFKALEHFKIDFGENHYYNAVTYDVIASSNYLLGRYNKAIEFGIMSLEIKERVTGKTNVSYTYTLNDLANCYSITGDFRIAEKYYLESISILSSLKLEDTEEFINYNNNLGSLYFELGDYKEALNIFNKMLINVINLYGKNSNQYANSLDKISISNLKLAQIKEAKVNLIIANSVLDDLENKNLYIKRDILGHLGEAYILSKNLDSAIIYFEKASKIFIDTKVDRSKDIEILSNLAHAFYLKKEFEMSKYLYLESINIKENHLESKKNVNDILPNYGKLSLIYFTQNKYDSAFYFCNKYLKLKLIDLYNLRYLDEIGLRLYNSNNIDDTNLIKFVSINNDKCSAEIYNLELRLKSISLQTIQLMRNTISTSNDSLLLQKLNEYLANRKKLSNWAILPLPEKPIELTEIEKKVEEEEKELIEKSIDFANIEKFWNITWQDIKSKLSTDEIAIELISFKDSSEITQYSALVIAANMESPTTIKLGTQSQLDEIYSKSLKIYKDIKLQTQSFYQSEELYNWFWKPLEEVISEKKTIYIAPVGSLNKINFSAIKTEKYKDRIENKDIHNLTSTREIIRLKSENSQIESNASLVILGDVDFDADSISLRNALKVNADNKTIENSSIVDIEEKRFPIGESFTPLYQTAEEVNGIVKIWKDIHPKVLIKAEASEENFKESKTPTILHFATHGYFFENPSTTMDTLNPINVILSSENPLLRSGLALAGANHVWSGNLPYTNMEDGILTAQEVSDMNLVGNKLVVLSACETALGKIDNTEGIYGLQRAFKMAGSTYILMSLWKVSDFHTKEMMLLFYQTLKEGNTIEQSYLNMQQQMKKRYPNPFYWASFVLIR